MWIFRVKNLCKPIYEWCLACLLLDAESFMTRFHHTLMDDEDDKFSLGEFYIFPLRANVLSILKNCLKISFLRILPGFIS